MNTSIRLVLIIMMVFVEPLYADSWQFDKELKSDTFTFGETEVTRIIDTRKDQHYPEFSVKVVKDGNEVALLKNLTFDRVAPFDKDRYILGVSNSGLSTFAYFVLDSSGNLLLTENHSEKIHYCKQSVTLVRYWVNEEDLSIEEQYRTYNNQTDDGESNSVLESVSVNGCDGRRVEVWTQ